MTAQLIRVDPHQPDPGLIRQAADALRGGLLVAFPTETVYGLGANALDQAAVARIFQVKGRPADDPLIVHLASVDWLAQAASHIPPNALKLAEVFWPGPLTMVLPRQPHIPGLVTAGGPTVAVRVPAHPVALALIRSAGVMVAAPSANPFGRTSPTQASHVLADLGESIEVILDGGPAGIGVESTVLDLTQAAPVILRPGGVTREDLSAVLGEAVVLGRGRGTGPMASPGLLPRHYAPRAELVFLQGTSDLGPLRSLARQALDQGRRVGLLVVEEDWPVFEGLPVVKASLGSQDDLWQATHRLYAALRALDELGVDLILARDLGEQGPGLALRDRLRRAARKIISA